MFRPPTTMLLSQLKEEEQGPVRVYLATGERDEAGNLVNDPDTGKPKQMLVLEKVYYRPNAVTPKLEAEINALSTSEDSNSRPVGSAASLLKAIVSRWDCYLDEKSLKANKPVSLTDEGLQDVPASLIYAVINACTEAQKPPKEQAEKSLSSFSTRDE